MAAGPCVGVQDSIIHAVGRLSADALRFKYSTDYTGGGSATGVHLKYSGRMQADGRYQGDVETDASNGKFIAIKLPEFGGADATTWKVDVDLAHQFKFILLCAFKPTGERISGLCGITQGPTLATNARLDGSKVMFSYDADLSGKTTQFDYWGKLQPDGSLTGTVKAGATAGTFTALRE